MDIRDYLDGARGVVSLPPGLHCFDDPIPENWEGLRICSADPKQPATVLGLVVYAAGVTIDNLTFSDSCKDYEKTAVMLRGEQSTVTRCQILPGYKYGVVSERQASITFNTILGFSDDGIRFCGNGTKIKHNTVGLMSTEIAGDPAHKDCIQGWAGDIDSPFRSAERFDAKHSLSEVEIVGNHLFDRPESTLQGITFFDGFADSWMITDNSIQLFGPHPLTVMGLRSGVVEDNVLMPDQEAYFPPARRWLASNEKWVSVADQNYIGGSLQC